MAAQTQTAFELGAWVRPKLAEPSSPSLTPSTESRERLRGFGAAIDAIRKRVEAEVGAEDVAYFRRLDRFSRRMELAGRTLIHFSFDPVTFSCGVLALWVHKQLQCEEIGHAVMHGVFDHLPDAKEYHSKTYKWDTPIDEESWEYAHVRGHHIYVNIVGKDDNIHFGFVRVNQGTPWHWYHSLQLVNLGILSLNFANLINFNVSGLNDICFGSGRPGAFDFIEERTPRAALEATRKAFRKYLPYHAKNYLFYPALAGPFFPKVLLGNWLAETMRDLWLAATIYSGHIANDVAVYPEGSTATSRDAYYAMQASATNNYEAGRWVSILSGGLDCHIEHHLFPHLPPNRLRTIRDEVRRTCEAHGVRYRSEPWPTLLKKAFAKMRELAKRDSTSSDAASIMASEQRSARSSS